MMLIMFVQRTEVNMETLLDSCVPLSCGSIGVIGSKPMEFETPHTVR